MIAERPLAGLSDERLRALRRDLAPEFANEQQRAFFDSRHPEVLYSGAFGAGKSRILVEKALALGRRHPGAPLGIFRKVRASLAATTQVTFLQSARPGELVRRNKTEGWYELANGSRFWLLGLDADTETGVPSKVGSLDLAFAFVDEAVELEEADWMMLLGRLRHPGVPYRQIGAATNPSTPDHWLKRRFTGDHPDRLYLSAPTAANRFLPPDYVARMQGLTGIYRERYVMGGWVALSGGLFDPAHIRRDPVPRTFSGGQLVPDLRRIVVAVDPAVTSRGDSDETGIVVAGVDHDGRAHVLADLSGRMPPDRWAQRAVDAWDQWGADRIVAEVNNGGDLVERNLRAVRAGVPFKAVTASRGKLTRAEPVASLYALGRVSHAEPFPELESQMVGYDGTGDSPDRMDALVWALTELMLTKGWGSVSGGAVA